MSYKRAQITVSPILYDKDTNNNYILDTNNDRVVLNDDIQQISSSSDYDVVITVQE